jgi:hypothetical protein
MARALLADLARQVPNNTMDLRSHHQLGHLNKHHFPITPQSAQINPKPRSSISGGYISLFLNFTSLTLTFSASSRNPRTLALTTEPPKAPERTTISPTRMVDGMRDKFHIKSRSKNAQLALQVCHPLHQGHSWYCPVSHVLPNHWNKTTIL